MVESDLSRLPAIVEQAATTIARLREQRHRLQQQVAALEERTATLEAARRADHATIQRALILEGEREAVRKRLQALLQRLQEVNDAN